MPDTANARTLGVELLLENVAHLAERRVPVAGHDELREECSSKGVERDSGLDGRSLVKSEARASLEPVGERSRQGTSAPNVGGEGADEGVDVLADALPDLSKLSQRGLDDRVTTRDVVGGRLEDG